LFFKNIGLAFADIKKQLEAYIASELTTAQEERHELLLAINSKLSGMLWEQKLMQMLNGNYKIFNEFLQVFKPKKYFTDEIVLIDLFKKTDDIGLFEVIVNNFEKFFHRTNSAKYTSRDIWFTMFAKGIGEEFSKYPYICWETILITLQEEKPLEFPCLNDILRRMDALSMNTTQEQITFLIKIKAIQP
jgi:hypothetical protein